MKPADRLLCRCGCGKPIKYGRWLAGHNLRSRPTDQKEEKNGHWKGDQVGYVGLHKWVLSHKAKTGVCSHCGKEKYTEWANVSGEYRRDLDDFIELCVSCHHTYDNERRRR